MSVAPGWPALWAALIDTDAPQRGPLHWAQLSALVRRTQAQQGAVRQRLDARLDVLLRALAQRQSARDATPAARVAPPRRSRRVAAAPAGPPPSPLAALNAELRQRLGEAGADPVTHPPDLRSAAWLAQWWSAHAARRDIEQSLNQVPEQAGPLNSQVLAQRTLALMQQLSPAYASHFVRRLDTLMWLEQVGVGRAPVNASRPARRAAG